MENPKLLKAYRDWNQSRKNFYDAMNRFNNADPADQESVDQAIRELQIAESQMDAAYLLLQIAEREAKEAGVS